LLYSQQDRNDKILVGKGWPGDVAFPDFPSQSAIQYWTSQVSGSDIYDNMNTFFFVISITHMVCHQRFTDFIFIFISGDRISPESPSGWHLAGYE